MQPVEMTRLIIVGETVEQQSSLMYDCIIVGLKLVAICRRNKKQMFLFRLENDMCGRQQTDGEEWKSEKRFRTELTRVLCHEARLTLSFLYHQTG